MMSHTTRRDFLIHGSIMTAGVVGGLTLGSRLLSPGPARAEKIVFPEPSCGIKTTSRNPKVLIAYASFCGSTGGVAQALGETFCQKGATVDVRLVKNVADISPYQAVVVGSAVRSSSWWPDAVEFVTRHEQALSRMPVAYFLTCLALYHDSPGAREKAMGYFEPALQAAPGIKPLDFGCFAGVLDYAKMNFMYRTIMKSKMKKQEVPEGDYRDWPAIRAWAETLAPQLGLDYEAGNELRGS